MRPLLIEVNMALCSDEAYWHVVDGMVPVVLRFTFLSCQSATFNRDFYETVVEGFPGASQLEGIGIRAEQALLEILLKIKQFLHDRAGSCIQL